MTELKHGSLFELVDCSVELPEEECPVIAFVPFLGFMSAMRGHNAWQSLITRLEIRPTFWIRPLDSTNTRQRLGIDHLAAPTQATSYTVKTIFKQKIEDDDMDFDVTTAIQKIEGVSYVCENYQILEEEYQDADYHIFTVDGFGDKQMEQLKSILNRFGMSAYVEGDDVIKIE
jgi:hypothetical protein